MRSRLRRRSGAAMMVATVGLLVLGASSALAGSRVFYTATPSASSLGIGGSADADVVSVMVSGATITISDPGGVSLVIADQCEAVDANTATCPVDPPDPDPANPTAPVSQLGLFLFEGDDRATTNAAFEVNADGGEGDDFIETGSGDDSLSGGPGDDELRAGDGNDELADGHREQSTGGNDLLMGGGGFDTAVEEGDVFFPGTYVVPVSITIDGVANDGAPSLGEADNYQVESFRGGTEADTLVGDDGPNEIVGNTGPDVINGNGGRDEIAGDRGDDEISGGPGSDAIDCGPGLDLGVGDLFDTDVLWCERTGAVIAGESAKVRTGGKRGDRVATRAKRGARTKVRVSCPLVETETCNGRVELLTNGKPISKRGEFTIAVGETRNAKLKLTRRGVRKLTRAGRRLLVEARVDTTYTVGTSVKSDEIMLLARRRR